MLSKASLYFCVHIFFKCIQRGNRFKNTHFLSLKGKDAIVDYFNYVILPVIIIIKFQFLPSAITYPICILILAASCYTFANVKQKTKDNYFNGFPALWNLLILYFYILQTEQIVNLFVVIVSLICTFLPIKYAHPLRVKNYKFLAIFLFSVWGVTSVILIYINSKEFLYQSVFWIWVIANALIFLVSLKRTFKFWLRMFLQVNAIY